MGYWSDGWKKMMGQYHSDVDFNRHCKKGFHRFVWHKNTWTEGKKYLKSQWFECEVCHSKFFSSPDDQINYYKHEKEIDKQNEDFLKWAKGQLED